MGECKHNDRVYFVWFYEVKEVIATGVNFGQRALGAKLASLSFFSNVCFLDKISCTSRLSARSAIRQKEVTSELHRVTKADDIRYRLRDDVQIWILDEGRHSEKHLKSIFWLRFKL